MTAMPRLIPILQVQGTSQVKTTQFRKPRYVGSAINSMRIFSEIEADEVIVIDLTSDSVKRSKEHVAFLESLCNEALMPLAYGGGVASAPDAVSLARLGFEKIVLGTAVHLRPGVINDVADALGAQVVIAAVDVRRIRNDYEVFIRQGRHSSGVNVYRYLDRLAGEPVGEVFVTSVDREGLRVGLDEKLLSIAIQNTTVPVIVSGGACSERDFRLSIREGASALAIGELAVCLEKTEATLVHLPFENNTHPDRF